MPVDSVALGTHGIFISVVVCGGVVPIAAIVPFLLAGAYSGPCIVPIARHDNACGFRAWHSLVELRLAQLRFTSVVLRGAIVNRTKYCS